MTYEKHLLIIKESCNVQNRNFLNTIIRYYFQIPHITSIVYTSGPQ